MVSLEYWLNLSLILLRNWDVGGNVLSVQVNDDKIDCSGNHLGFSHPSYSEALPYLLVEDGYITRINREIFNKILFKLSEKDEDFVVGAVAFTMAENLSMLSEEVKNLLSNLLEDARGVWYLVQAALSDFKKCPEEIRNWLFEVSEKDEFVRLVGYEIGLYFNKLPEEVRNKLLFLLSEKDATARDVALAVADNFDMLPEEVRNKLLFSLSEKDAAVEIVAKVVGRKFNKLPEEVRNKLLFLLSEIDEVLLFTWDNVPGNDSERLLKFFRDYLGIVWAENARIYKLDDKTIQLCCSESSAKMRSLEIEIIKEKRHEKSSEIEIIYRDKEKGKGYLEHIIGDNLKVKKEGGKLNIYYDGAIGAVARTVTWNFWNLPEEVRNKLLFILSEKDAAAGAIAWFVSDEYNMLSEEERTLLFTLSEKGAAARAVAWAVADNFDKLPDAVRNLLDKLQKPLQEVIEDLSSSEERKEKETALYLISYALPKLNQDFVSKILKELSECEHETVRLKAAKMLKALSDDSKGENTDKSR